MKKIVNRGIFYFSMALVLLCIGFYPILFLMIWAFSNVGYFYYRSYDEKLTCWIAGEYWCRSELVTVEDRVGQRYPLGAEFRRVDYSIIKFPTLEYFSFELDPRIATLYFEKFCSPPSAQIIPPLMSVEQVKMALSLNLRKNALIRSRSCQMGDYYVEILLDQSTWRAYTVYVVTDTPESASQFIGSAAH